MKNLLLFLTVIALLIPLKGYSCECSTITSSFTKRLKQTDEIVLGQIKKELPSGYLEIEIIKDYANRINAKSILLFNGGGIDCLRNFSNVNGNYMIFALNKHVNSTENQIIYEVPICIESALSIDRNLNFAEGNISRFNTFKTRLNYFFKSYDYPKNTWRLERIEKRIKKKIR